MAGCVFDSGKRSGAVEADDDSFDRGEVCLRDWGGGVGGKRSDASVGSGVCGDGSVVRGVVCGGVFEDEWKSRKVKAWKSKNKRHEQARDWVAVTSVAAAPVAAVSYFTGGSRSRSRSWKRSASGTASRGWADLPVARRCVKARSKGSRRAKTRVVE